MGGKESGAKSGAEVGGEGGGGTKAAPQKEERLPRGAEEAEREKGGEGKGEDLGGG